MTVSSVCTGVDDVVIGIDVVVDIGVVIGMDIGVVMGMISIGVVMSMVAKSLSWSLISMYLAVSEAMTQSGQQWEPSRLNMQQRCAERLHFEHLSLGG